MSTMTEERIAELRKEHGEVAVARTRFGDFVFKPPELEDYEIFKDKLLDAQNPNSKQSLGAAQREFCQCCLADATQLSDLQTYFKKQPGSVAKIADRLGDLAGNEVEVEIKKG